MFRLERDTGTLRPGAGRGRRREQSQAAYVQPAAAGALCLHPAAPTRGDTLGRQGSRSAHRRVMRSCPSYLLLQGPGRHRGSSSSGLSPPCVRTAAADGPRDKALASLPRRGDGKGPVVSRLRPCSRGQAASSPGSGAQLLVLGGAEPEFCQPARVKPAALFLRQEPWCCGV